MTAPCRRLTLNAVVETPTATLLHKRAQRHAAAVARVVSKWVQPAQAEATAAAAPDATAGPGTTPSNGSGTMPNGLGPAPEPHSAPAEGGIHTSAPPPLSAAPVAAAAAAATGAGPASPRAFPTSPRAGSSSSAEGSGTEPGELFRGHTSLKYVLPGHDLTATLGWQQDYVDSSGEYAHVPLAASLDLASQYRPDGLQYRVGLHQVGGWLLPLSTSSSAAVIYEVAKTREQSALLLFWGRRYNRGGDVAVEPIGSLLRCGRGRLAFASEGGQGT